MLEGTDVESGGLSALPVGRMLDVKWRRGAFVDAAVVRDASRSW